MFVAWGKDLGFLYNDPYSEILGAKHPAALGKRFYDIWSEIWSDISPLIDAAMAVTAPTPNSLGAATVRAMVSAMTTAIAPPNADAGNSIR